MNCNRKMTTSALFLGCFVLMHTGAAAEFADSDIIPEIASIVFSQHAVGLTVEPRGLVDRTTDFFIADRDDHEFNQVSKQEFSQLLEDDHFHSQIGTYHHSGVFLGHQNQLAKRDVVVAYDGSCEYHEIVPRRFKRNDVDIAVSLKCSSRVSDALILGDEIWVATFQSGDHGEYGAEELVIASLDHDCVTRIDTGGYPHYGLAKDPWSSDVWVVSQDRITVVDKEHRVSQQFWPIHKFDEVRKRPDLFVLKSQVSIESDPFAILAYDLGQDNFQYFFRAIQDLTEPPDEQLMYLWNMADPRPTYDPRLPKELNVLVPHAESSYAWLKFVCMLDDERAKQLCSLDMDKWP